MPVRMGLRILILSRTPIGKQMSSPGIRYVNMRRVLEAAIPDATVTIAAPEGYRTPDGEEFGTLYYEPLKALALVRHYDVVIGMSFPLSVTVASPFFRRPLLVLDFFSQFHFEWMEVGRDNFTGLHREIWTRTGQLYANLQLLIADFITCANERQRDAYIGVMSALGLLTVPAYEQDATLRRLIDVVPHGVREEPFPEGPGGVKGTYPGIEKTDKLLLWLGGILYWYDPLTLLRALARARKSHPELKLLFLGTQYPGEGKLGQGVRLRQTIEEAKRLGMWDNGVYMHSEWLSQAEVTRYLQDADAAITTYFTNAETRFAHRTRFQDYIWARLPIICTEGDVLAEQVNKRGWGLALPEGDEEAIYRALMRVAEDGTFLASCRTNLAQAAQEMTWEAAFEPLVRFLRRPGGPTPVAEPRSQRLAPIVRSSVVYFATRMLERGVGALQARVSPPR
jgi:glycosyltransferase involved in cell wall biosynthesis